MKNFTRSSLFYGIIKVLSLATLVPVIIVGFYMLNLDEQLIKRELYERQRVLVGSVETSLRSFLARRIGLLRIYAQMHNSVLGPHIALTKEDLKYFMSEYPEFKALAVLDVSGGQKFSEGDINISSGKSGEINAIKYICIQNGEPYIGIVKIHGEEKKILLAVPIKDAANHTSGALAAEITIDDVLSDVGDMFPSQGGMFSAVFTQDSRLIYSSKPLNAAMFKNYAETAIESNSEFKDDEGIKYLSTKGIITSLGWVVYIGQPATHWTRLFIRDKNSIKDIIIMVFCVAVFIYLAGRFFIKPVIDPLKELQYAAYKVGQENFKDLPRIEDMPSNEIGDLAKSFLVMAASLKKRKIQAESAAKELEEINKFLEEKVEERTRDLNAAAERLVQKERLAAIGEIASVISHEIRNPLAVISNSAKLIKAMSPEGNAKLEKQFNIIEAEVRQANKIVEEVLGYARSRKPVVSRIEVNSYLKDLLFSYPWPENILLEEHLLKEPVYVKIDAEEMKQAVRNLISNAIEVMPNGGTLVVSAHTGARALCISVTDQGPGITEAEKQKIFSPFYTTKARGTGLGLAVVKKAVLNNKGKIFVKSILDKGTTFYIYFKREPH